jgi:hypothetical protein
VVLWLYFSLVGGQGDNSGMELLQFELMGLLGAMAIAAAVASLWPQPWLSILLFSATGTVCLLLGYLALFSIGLPLLLIAGLLVLADLRTLRAASATRAAAALVGGASIALALVAAIFVPTMSAKVECLPGGERA